MSTSVAQPLTLKPETHSRLRQAGWAYLVIIFCGLTAEMYFRPEALAAIDMAERVQHVRHGLLLDTLMVGADVILAMLLFVILRPVAALPAMIAMVLRLMQAATIAASLMLQIAAIHMPDQAEVMMAIGADGYDLALIFFAGNTAVTAWLLCHAGFTPKFLPPALMMAAVVYLIGSLTALSSPAFSAKFELAYLIPLVAEVSFCLWLLFGHRGTNDGAKGGENDTSPTEFTPKDSPIGSAYLEAEVLRTASPLH